MAISERDKSLVELVGQIYSAAGHPASWVTALGTLSRLLDSSSAYLFTNSSRNAEQPLSILGGDRVDPASASEYADYYVHIDPRQPPGTALQAGTIYTDAMLAPGGTLEGTELLHDFLYRYDVPNTGGIVISNDGSTQVLLSVSGSRRHGPFTSDSLDLLTLVAPHVRKALSLHRELRGAACQAELMGDALDRLRCGACIVNASGRVLRVNRVGERILGRSDGLRLRQGRLGCIDAQADRELQRQLGRISDDLAAAGRTLQDLVRVERRLGAPYLLRIVPLADQERGRGSKVEQLIVLMMDPDDRTQPDGDALRQLYGLTPAEVRIALALAKGQVLSEIALESSISLLTVRTHVKRILQKTGARNQAGLIRELLTVASLGRRPKRLGETDTA